MLEDSNLPTTLEDEELDEAIDASLESFPLALREEEKQIVKGIMKAPTQKDLEDQFALFNINQSKINALRVIKLTDLLGKVEDQAIQRFNKHPENFSNRELLDYMQVVSNQIDRSQRVLDTINAKPAIKVTNPKTEVNINIGTELNRDSKERVIDAIQSLLKQLDTQAHEENVIDADLGEPEYSDEDMMEPETDELYDDISEDQGEN